jgi:ERCC4-type nuclease
MKLILDERETSLYEKCKTLSNPAIILEKIVLPMGDAIIKTNDDKELIIIERKSLQDLLSSIKDGRYEEQSYRLQNCCNGMPHNVMYIIEGVFSQLRNPTLEKRMIYSAMTTLSAFKGFSVIRTSSVQETADWLMAYADKLGRELEKGKNLCFYKKNTDVVIENLENVSTDELVTPSLLEPAKYCEVVKRTKKENLTPENIGEVILCQIPGISSVSAIAIMKEFKTIANLITAVEKDPMCMDKLICESGGKSRKISKAVVQNVKTYIVGTS